MLIVISPAKSLDFENPAPVNTHTLPGFVAESEQIINKLRTLSRKKLRSLMGISENLAILNQTRYAEWTPEFSIADSKQAIFAFKGDVYLGLQAENYTEEDLDYAQDHLRILSGLHGLLRPLDLIHPYRLEMGSSLPLRRKKNLYEFWGDRISETLNKALESQNDKLLINLASQEYFKAVRTDVLDARVITPHFRYLKNGKLTQISFFAKKARGAMSSFIIQNRLTDPEDIKGFDQDGYRFDPAGSKDDTWLFVKDVD
jgi:cytoplasmic iron level regulating protein YaaA (DUF328/UPF0246 family)